MIIGVNCRVKCNPYNTLKAVSVARHKTHYAGHDVSEQMKWTSCFLETGCWRTSHSQGRACVASIDAVATRNALLAQ